MTLGRYELPRGEPFYWWGPVLVQPGSQTLGQLVGQQMLSAQEAAVLAALLRRGASIFVVSLASGAGKSTLLDAVVQSGPAHRGNVYLRGAYETFRFLDECDPQRTCLLVNEISPHLPIYLWGSGVRTFLHAAGTGFQLCATVHAVDATSFIHLLTSPPLDVPLADVNRPKVVVTLHPVGSDGDVRRSVRSITAITPGTTAQATALNDIAERLEPGGPVQIFRERLASFLRVAGLEPAGFYEEVTAFRNSLSDRAGSAGGAE
ncbi:hypothetical protein BH20CHL4_BH20CHL4_06180 [soil metagenome]